MCQNRPRSHSHNDHREPRATKLICDNERQEDCLLIELYSIKKTPALQTHRAGQSVQFFMWLKGLKTVFNVKMH